MRQRFSGSALLLSLAICAALLSGGGDHPAQGAEQLIELRVRDVMDNQALLYRSGSSRAAVLVHQSGATMESWRDLATNLQGRGITALSLAVPTPYDVQAGVGFLIDEGFQDIVLLGASIGGGAIMQALAMEAPPAVRKIVLLAPSSGPALSMGEIDKLFLVAKADFYKQRAYQAFEEAADPKRLVEFDGRDHGQALLDGAYAEAALQAIIDFLGN